MAEGSGRKKPNILVTGTPGTGKTTTSSLLAESTQLRHINIGDLVRNNNLHDGWDDHFDCHIINEDLVILKPPYYYYYFISSLSSFVNPIIVKIVLVLCCQIGLTNFVFVGYVF
ncbi:hypothetical protein CsSME_00016619 [Camellia sinensis var. sinensis]